MIRWRIKRGREPDAHQIEVCHWIICLLALSWTMLNLLVQKQHCSRRRTQIPSVEANFVSAWDNPQSYERREPQWRKCLHKIVPYTSLVDIFFISNGWGRAQPMVGGATPGLLVLGSVASWASHREQASMRHPSMATPSAPASSILPCLNLPWCPSMLKSDMEINTFHPVSL